MTMNNTPFFAALALSALMLPAAADLNIPASSLAGLRAEQGTCDLLSSNTVRATFVGLRQLAVQSIEENEAATQQVAVFQVIENLAHRRYVRYGDGPLQEGSRFSIVMDRQLPGQPAEVVDTIASMKEGEESVMRVDHLYMLGSAQEGKPLRVCSRMARRDTATAVGENTPAAPAEQDADVPTTVAPLGGGSAPQSGDAELSAALSALGFPGMNVVKMPGMNVSVSGGTGRSEAVSVTMDAKGNKQVVRTVTETDSKGKNVTRMYINDVEVDPQTKQPLKAVPAQKDKTKNKKEAKDADDDTILESDTSAPSVAPLTPAVGAEEEDGF